MSELSESPLQEDNLTDFNGNSNGIHWDDQILNGALPPYKPVIHEDEPFKPQNFYTCPICHDRYLLQSSLDFHMKRRSLQIKYHCQNCNRFITDYNRCSFLNHLQQHSDSGGYLTDTLQVTVTPLAEDQMRTDQQTSENKDGVQNFFLKTIQHSKNGSPSEIISNETVVEHTEEQDQQRTTSEESLYTTAMSAIKVSNKSLTTSEVCKECGMKLLIDLRNHLLRPNCYVDPGLECQQCKLILPSICSLRAHKRYHQKLRPHTCPECGRIFSLWASFLVHLNYSCFHLARCIRFRCPKCATLFYSVDLLETHFFSEHIKTVFKCDLCPIACFDIFSVDQHKAIAHGKKEVKTLQFQQCQICPERLTPKDQIAGHMLEHTRSKKCLAFGFECNGCKNFFQQKAVFGAHHCNGPPAVADGAQGNDSQGDNMTAATSDSSTENTSREGSKNTSVSSATDYINNSDNSVSINNLETPADNVDEYNWNNTTSISSQRTDMPKCLPVKILTRSFPVKKLSSPKNVLPKPVTQKPVTQIEKPPIRQYGNNKISNVTVKSNGNRLISTKHIALTQDLKKNTLIANILPAQTAVRSNVGTDAGVLKVRKVIRSCSLCKSEIIFHSPSLEQVSMLPSKCYNCLKKHNAFSSSGSIFTTGTKTIVHLQKTHNPNKTVTVVSAPKLMASSVSGTVTTTHPTTVIPNNRYLKPLGTVVTEKLQETKESARFAFNGPHSSTDSKSPTGQFKCHICKKLINIQANDIQDHFSKEHKNIEIRTLTPLLKKINIEQSHNGKELSTIIKTEPVDTDSLETPLNTNSGEKSETSEPPKKRKKSKLGSKDKPPPPVTPFSSGKLIFPVIKKENNRYECFKCHFTHADKGEFESHVLLHKTDSSSFQCMECGMCFIVQPSFEKHLLVSHGIKDVEKYVNENLNCKQDSYDPYNGFSPVTVSSDDDADEHKCSVCHDSFETSEELDKHFRVHGMAFLLKKQRELRQIITA